VKQDEHKAQFTQNPNQISIAGVSVGTTTPGALEQVTLLTVDGKNADDPR